MTQDQAMAVWGMGSLLCGILSVAGFTISMIWDQTLAGKISCTVGTLSLFSFGAALWVQTLIDKASS